ncbi:hypothetical protein DYB35_013780, partial [Aphanomyces astaci]
MLCVMTMETPIDVGLTEDKFKAGWHWIQGFKHRHGLSLRAKTRIGQASTIDSCCELQVTSIEDPTKDNTVWVKCGGKPKERATVMQPADTTGKKYPLYLVMKSKKSTVKEVVHDNLTMRQGFGRQCDFSRREGGKRVNLLCYNFSAHFAESIYVILERVQPRFTSCCQPAVVAWIRSLKTNLRDRWLVEILRQLRNSKAANQNLKLAGPSRSAMVQWITGAWNEVPVSVILNGFRKCKLIDCATVEVFVTEDSLDDGDIADLMADFAVEETIDPAQDIGAVDDLK